MISRELGDMKVKVRTEAVEADAPGVIEKSLIKEWGMVIIIRKKTNNRKKLEK